MISLGIDPDLKTSAFAWIVDGEVQALQVVKAEKSKTPVVSMVDALWKQPWKYWVNQNILVVESQQIYQGTSSAVPQHLIRLAQVAGACLMFQRNSKTRVFLPLPSQWKGSVPKEIHQARVLRKVGIEPKKGAGYCYPADPKVLKRWGFPKGSWKHLSDAIGLALWGLEQDT